MVLKPASKNSKSSGNGRQTIVLVAPGVLLTLTIRNSNSVPDPLSTLLPVAKADMRRVLIVPAPLTFPDTFHWVAVSPAGCTGWLRSKLTTDESKVKSPWKPIKFWLAVMFVVITGSMITVVIGTEVSKVSIGRDTFSGTGVGVGVGV